MSNIEVNIYSTLNNNLQFGICTKIKFLIQKKSSLEDNIKRIVLIFFRVN